MVRLTRRLSGSRLTIVVFNSPGGSFAPRRLLPALACLHKQIPLDQEDCHGVEQLMVKAPTGAKAGDMPTGKMK
jgi:hypothetical protein